MQSIATCASRSDRYIEFATLVLTYHRPTGTSSHPFGLRRLGFTTPPPTVFLLRLYVRDQPEIAVSFARQVTTQYQ